MKENSAQLYGQVTQDGCSPVLCTSPAWPCLLPLSHMTLLSKPFPQAPASDCSYQKGSEGRAPYGSLATKEPTGHQFPCNWWSLLSFSPLTKTATRCRPPYAAEGGVLSQDLALDTEAPPSIKPLMSLLLTPGLFFALKVRQIQAF